MSKKKLIAFLALVSGVLVVTQCASPESHSHEGVTDGQSIYLQYCVTCHGVDGTLGLSGAAMLPETQLTEEGIIQVVTDGRGLMIPYSDILTTSEINKVSEFILTLKK